MGTNVWTIALVAALTLVSCSSGSDGAVEPDDESTNTTETAEGSDETELSTDTTEPLIAAIPDVEPVIAGADQIITLTPVEVDRLRPLLAWEPVDGAQDYSVVVLDEAGEPYWVWNGPEAEVPLGGVESSDFGVGPIIGVDYSWSVAAFDADGGLLAVSGQLPITTG